MVQVRLDGEGVTPTPGLMTRLIWVWPAERGVTRRHAHGRGVVVYSRDRWILA